LIHCLQGCHNQQTKYLFTVYWAAIINKLEPDGQEEEVQYKAGQGWYHINYTLYTE